MKKLGTVLYALLFCKVTVIILVIGIWFVYISEKISLTSFPYVEHLTFGWALLLSCLVVFFYHLAGPMSRGKVKTGVGPPLSFLGLIIGVVWVFFDWLLF